MLNKLLKYDLKNQFSLLGPLYLIFLVVTILSVIMGNISNNSAFLNIIDCLLLFFYIIILIGLFVITFFQNIKDFYVSFATSDGYLINTLPVSKGSIIFSKLLTGIIALLSSLLVVILSIVIFCIGNLGFSDFISLFDAFKYFTTDMYLFLFLFILFFFISYILNLATCYLSVSLGQLKNSNKLGFSFVAYVVIYMITQFCFSISLVCIEYFFPSILSNVNNLINSVNILFLIFMGLSLIITVIFLIITNYLLKNKLNLQ